MSYNYVVFFDEMSKQQTHLLRVCLLGIRREVEPEQYVKR